MWQAIELKQSLMDLAKDHMQNCAMMHPSGHLDHHIAIHVRRGDYKYFNCDLHIASTSVPVERQLHLQEVWGEADVAVEVIRQLHFINQKKKTSINLLLKLCHRENKQKSKNNLNTKSFN